MNERKNEEFEIDLLDLLQVLLSKIWIIIVVSVLGGAIAFGYTFAFIKPQYTASTLLYVNNSNISVEVLPSPSRTPTSLQLRSSLTLMLLS